MNPHLAPPVVHAGAALATSRAVTVLVHGRAQTPDVMLDIAKRIDLPDMAYLAVAALGHTWYPKGFMAPLAENQPDLDFALERIDLLIADLVAKGRSRERIALLGFSQGACLLCEYVARRGGRWGALVAFTGGVLGPDGDPFACRPLLGTPVLLATANPDEWVPPGRVWETASLMTRAGGSVDVCMLDGIGHTVADEEIARARTVLERLLRKPRSP